MSGQRCPSCGGYEWNNEVCKFCGYMPKIFKPGFELGKVDPFKLAEGLKAKEEQKRRQAIPRLSNCPYCSEHSLFYNAINDSFECLNSKLPCPKYKNLIIADTAEYNDIITHFNEGQKREERSEQPHTDTTHSLSIFMDDYFLHSHSDEFQSSYQENLVNSQSELINPMLLSVKMFLADVIYIINSKYEEGHVCANFAQEVCDVATKRGIRCGYVVISFEKGDVAHAIVAFQTDYGLKFFEPQNANEEDVKVGRRYSTQLEVVPKDNIITKIEIQWNDGTITTIGK